jgi:RimJ/RimL family protein N-acetyltransferase
MDSPELTDGVVILNGLREHDAARIVRLDDDAIRWAFFRVPTATLDTARKEIEHANRKWRRSSRFRRFAIRLADDPAEMIGSLFLHPSSWNSGDVIDLWLGVAYRGFGYGKRAVRLACEFAMDTLRVSELSVEVRSGNDASHRLALAVGFVPVSTRWHHDGTAVTVYALTRERWDSLSS